MVLRVLDNTGYTVRASTMVYKTVVQTVLLYGINSWVIPYSIMKVLEGFHHQIARRITGETDCCVREGFGNSPRWRRS